MNELISVIVPVYNCEKYISSCIDSIIHQTYKNIEVLLIDDGSTDNSLEICQSYCNSDSRIKVFHQENSGAGGARNTGLKISRGEYVTFVDGDDTIDCDFIKDTLELARVYSSDIVITGFSNSKNDDLEVWNMKKCLDLFFRINGEEDNHSVCGKLIRYDVLQGFSFMERCMNEDVVASYELALRSYITVFIKKNYYHYFKNPNGVTNSRFTIKRLDLLKMWEYLMAEVEKNQPDYSYYAHMNYLRAHVTLLIQMHVFKYDKTDEKLIALRSELKKTIRKNYFKLIRWKMPVSRKLAMTVLML